MKKTIQTTLVFLVLLLISGLVWISQREPLSQVDLMKSADTSQFVKLSKGWTEFRDAGSANGEHLILVHGFSVPMFFWEPLERRLIEKGIRVFSYNQYGRGYSSYPKASYDREMYMTQLLEFMDSLGIKKAHMAGQSMGASLVTHFASKYPNRVKSVTLLSPMLDNVTDNGGIRFCRTPIIGCPMTNLLIANIIYKRSEKLVYSCDNVPHEEWLANMREQAKIEGFRQSVTTLFHTDALESYLNSYIKLGELSIPTMMVTGGEDNSVPQKHFTTIEKVLPQVKRTSFPNNNHVVVIQRVDSVSALITDFLQSTTNTTLVGK